MSLPPAGALAPLGLPACPKSAVAYSAPRQIDSIPVDKEVIMNSDHILHLKVYSLSHSALLRGLRLSSRCQRASWCSVLVSLVASTPPCSPTSARPKSVSDSPPLLRSCIS